MLNSATNPPSLHAGAQANIVAKHGGFRRETYTLGLASGTACCTANGLYPSALDVVAALFAHEKCSGAVKVVIIQPADVVLCDLYGRNFGLYLFHLDAATSGNFQFGVIEAVNNRGNDGIMSVGGLGQSQAAKADCKETGVEVEVVHFISVSR